MISTLSKQVETLIEWAASEARRTRRRHYVRAVRTPAGWYYEADKYPLMQRIER